MSEHDELVKRLYKYAETVAFGSDLREAAQAIERLEGENKYFDGEVSRLRHGNRAYEGDVNRLEQQLADARARALAEMAKKAEQVTHSALIAWLDGEILATPAPEPRVIPDGAHHSGLMKDYGGRYNPASLDGNWLIRENLRLSGRKPAPSTGEAEPCTVRWCKSGLPATRRATDCHDDGAWNVAICQQCFDAFDLGRDGEDLPGPKEAQRLLRAAQQQEQEG